MTLNTLHDMDIMDEVELINELTIESEPSINDFEDVIIDTVLNEDNTQFDDDIKCVVEEVEYDPIKSDYETSGYMDDHISVETVEHNEVQNIDDSSNQKQNVDLIECVSFDSDIINDSATDNCPSLPTVLNDNSSKITGLSIGSNTSKSVAIENASASLKISTNDSTAKYNNIIIKNQNFPHFVKLKTPIKHLENSSTSTRDVDLKRTATVPFNPNNMITKVFIGQNNSGKPFILPKSPIKIAHNSSEIKNTPTIKAITIAQAQQLGLLNTGKLQKIQSQVTFNSSPAGAVVDIRPTLNSTSQSPRIISVPNYTQSRNLAPKILFKQPASTVHTTPQGSCIIKVPATTHGTVPLTVKVPATTHGTVPLTVKVPATTHGTVPLTVKVPATTPATVPLTVKVPVTTQTTIPITTTHVGSNVNNNKVQYIVITTSVSTPPTNAVVISIPNNMPTVSSIDGVKPITVSTVNNNNNNNNNTTVLGAAEKVKVNSSAGYTTMKKLTPIRPNIKVVSSASSSIVQNSAHAAIKSFTVGDVAINAATNVVNSQTSVVRPILTAPDVQNQMKENLKVVDPSSATTIDGARHTTQLSDDDGSPIKTFVFSKYMMPAGPFLTNGPTKSRRPCNCTRSQCLKLYCECFANGDFCYLCNCNSCLNNMEHEENRQHAIRSCLDRNPHAFEPKINKRYNTITGERQHTKGCNCKRSNCLKNYCECYEAKIPCSTNCKCVGCKNIDESVRDPFDVSYTVKTDYPGKLTDKLTDDVIDDLGEKYTHPGKRDCYQLVTEDVVEATCQCLMAQAVDAAENDIRDDEDILMIIEEFGNCLVQIIGSNTRNRSSNNDDEIVNQILSINTETV